MIQSKTTSGAVVWTVILRPRVNDIVTHNNATWVNATGANAEPSTTTDWLLLTPADVSSRLITINSATYELTKNPSNSTQGTVESNDIVLNGFLAANVFLNSARFTGTDATNFGTLANNYTDGDYSDVNYSNW